jgi:hypothetical protein
MASTSPSSPAATYGEIYRYSEPHTKLDNYASYRQKHVTFDIPDETEPSRDISEHRDIERPTEVDRAVKINIVTNECEPNKVFTNTINDTDNRDPTEDRRGTNDEVQIVQDGKITKKKIHIYPKKGNKDLKKREG